MHRSLVFARTLSFVLGGLVVVSLCTGCRHDAERADAGDSHESTSSSVTTQAATPGEALVTGSAAPDFHAKTHDGTELRLAALKGKPVVLYFYPRDETPGCTKEANAFRDSWEDLSKAGVVVIGVSTDTPEAHRSFAQNHHLPFHLVSDADGAIAKAYGVPKRGAVLARQTFVIDADGKIKKVYRTVDVNQHASEVLADVRS